MREIKDYKIIVALIILQLLVTLPFISSAAISIDEPFSIFYAQQDIEFFLPFLSQGNNPPLHFVVLHYWISLFGISPLSVRSLSLVFSILTIPALYNFGKKILNKNFSIVLVCFMIFSTFNHYHALEARVYSLMVLLTVLIFNEIYNLIFRKEFGFVKLAFWNVLLMYSHYLGGIIVVVEVIVLGVFFFKLTKRKVLHFVYSGIISLILYAPALIFLIERVSDFSKNGTWVAKPQVSELYGNIVRFFNAKFSVLLMGLVVLVVVIYNRKLIIKDRCKGVFTQEYIFVFLIFGLPYFGMYLFSILKQPIFIDRYILFTTPFLFLSFLILVKYVLFEKKANLVLLFVVLPMAVFCKFVPDTDRDPDEIAEFVNDFKTDNVEVLICPPFYDLTFKYHFDQEGFKEYKNVNLMQNIHSIYSISQPMMDSLLKSNGSVFFVDAKSKFLFPENTILEDLKSNFQLDRQEEFKGGYKVYQFSNIQ